VVVSLEASFVVDVETTTVMIAAALGEGMAKSVVLAR